jgi:cytochrome c peroxidase
MNEPSLRRLPRKALLGFAAVATAAVALAAAEHAGLLTFSSVDVPNDDGAVRTVVVAPAPVDVTTHPFWKASANGRSCATCHSPGDGMSLSASTVGKIFKDSVATGILDALFAAVDGADCPNKPLGVEASHSMLLKHGAIRIARPWPPRDRDGSAIDPEFSIEVVNDPTGCNTDATWGLNGTRKEVSVYRRPRMAANLEFILAGDPSGWSVKDGLPLEAGPVAGGPRLSGNIMSDGRHPTLDAQAQDAFRNHLQGSTLSASDLAAIVDFEKKVYTAQILTKDGASLPNVAAIADATAAPRNILGAAPEGPGAIFPEFENIDALIGAATTPEQKSFLESAKRGYGIFKGRPFFIKDVANLNSTGIGNPVKNACITCHNHQRTGNDLAPGFMDLGVVNQPQSMLQSVNTDYPLFRLVCQPSAKPHPYLGREILTNDPGTALVTGKCEDIGALNIPQLRGLASRAPYFTNGSAPTLRAVVEYYNGRFDIRHNAQEIQDLVNFLKVL